MILGKKITNQKILFENLSESEIKILKEFYNFLVDEKCDELKFTSVPEKLEQKLVEGGKRSLVNRGYVEKSFLGGYRFTSATFKQIHSCIDKKFAERVGYAKKLKSL